MTGYGGVEDESHVPVWQRSWIEDDPWKAVFVARGVNRLPGVASSAYFDRPPPWES